MRVNNSTYHEGLLNTLTAINSISNKKDLHIDQKLDQVLLKIVKFMQAKSGSIMLVKGRSRLEVVASTNKRIAGMKQALDDISPSTWVVKNGLPLYVDNIKKSDMFQKRFNHYQGDAFLLVPILGDKKVIGVISITDRIKKDEFSRDEQKALLELAGQIISALENQRLAESLKKKKRILQKKNLELRKLEVLKADLYNMLIHDLKGPISEVMANLDILSYTTSEEDEECVQAARGACDTLYLMVSNLLDIARLEEGRLELIHEKINPADLIREVLSRVAGLGKLKEIGFEESCQPEKPEEYFWGDRGVLLRVLQNLITNAINYSPEGENIELGYKFPKPGEIEFFVKDKGPGVPHEHRETIFDKYKQLEKKNDGRIYTTGLGLTFCKMAVGAHRGKIGVESGDTGTGSRFFFTLPLGSETRD